VVFSNSGKTKEVIELIDLVHNLGYDNLIMGIFGQSNNYVNLKCSDYIEFGKVEEICPMGLTPTTSTTCMSVISDLLVVGLMEKRGYNKKKYSKVHHGGYLGEESKK
jgi:arabinose-5-phosphate isomerase